MGATLMAIQNRWRNSSSHAKRNEETGNCKHRIGIDGTNIWNSLSKVVLINTRIRGFCENPFTRSINIS